MHYECYINGNLKNLEAINANFNNSRECYEYLIKNNINCGYWEKCLATLIPTKIAKKDFIYLKTKPRNSHHSQCPYLDLIQIKKVVKTKSWNFIMEKYPKKTKYINNQQVLNPKPLKTIKITDLFNIVKNNIQRDFLKKNKIIMQKIATNDKQIIMLLKIIPTTISK